MDNAHRVRLCRTRIRDHLLIIEPGMDPLRDCIQSSAANCIVGQIFSAHPAQCETISEHIDDQYI